MTHAVECRAILFDMDGTLVDSTSIIERQWKRFADRHKLDYAHIMRVSHGRRNEETIREVAPHLATSEIFAAFDAEELGDRDGATAVAGSAELLRALNDSEWAVVTSASRVLAQTRLASVGLPVPGVLVGADSVAHGKPDPEGYLLAARRLGVEPRDCVVFEDTPPGLAAGRAAGAEAIGLVTTYPRERLAPFSCIANFEGIRVERIANGGLRLHFPALL